MSFQLGLVWGKPDTPDPLEHPTLSRSWRLLLLDGLQKLRLVGEQQSGRGIHGRGREAAGMRKKMAAGVGWGVVCRTLGFSGQIPVIKGQLYGQKEPGPMGGLVRHLVVSRHVRAKSTWAYGVGAGLAHASRVFRARFCAHCANRQCARYLVH